MTTIEEFRERYIYDQKADHLGDGTFGNVFRAYDTHKEKYVAIKIVNLTNSENAKYNLVNEARIAQDIRDKKNIAVYKVCYKVSTPTGFADIAVMELYEGNLKHLLENTILTDTVRAQLIAGLINGLENIHRHKIIHRDLKPENILIDIEDGSIVPKISDFGISKKSDNLERSGFSNSLVGGTIAYSSPEQLKAETQSLKINTDIWSLGVILYEIFTGTNPFSHGLENLRDRDEKRREILKRIRVAELPKELAGIPEPYQKIIRRCIVANPDKRIASISQVKDILDRFEEDRGRTQIAVPEEVKVKNARYVFDTVAFICIITAFVGLSFSLGLFSRKSNGHDTAGYLDAALDTPTIIDGGAGAGNDTIGPSSLPIKPRSVTDTVLGYSFVYVPWGDTVKLDNGKDTFIGDFYIGATEVTQAQWKKIMGNNPSVLSKCDNCPVDNVSLSDVQNFLKVLDERTGKNYRLPHIRELGYAYNGGKRSNKFKYSGSDTLSEVAWWSGNSKDRTHPVATKKANGLGLFDLDGNVEEWSSSRLWEYDHYTKMYLTSGTRYWSSIVNYEFSVCNTITKAGRKDGMGFRIVFN